MASQSLKYALSSLKDIEKDIIANYRKALANIQSELIKLDNRMAEQSMDEVLKYNRLNTLKDKIYAELKTTARANYKVINDTRYDVFETSYKTEMNKFEEDGTIAAWLISKILERPISGQSFKDNMKDLARDGLKKISGKITQGVIQGKGVNEISVDVKDALTTNAKKTITTARTETLRAMSDGQEESFSELEDKGYKVVKIWQTKQDDKVRGNPVGQYPNSEADHYSMDGVEADEDGMFYVPLRDGGTQPTVGPHASGNPAVDINCRCSILITRVE